MNIKRQTRLVRMGAPVTIFIGDKHKAALYNGDSLDIDLPDGQTQLTIKHSRQTAITVSDEDKLLLKDNPLNLLLFWSGVFLILGSHVLLSFDNPLLFYLTLTGFISLASSYFVPRFRWEHN
ncbi:hypothetical protein ML603_03065 [Streptococcus dysgalactiae subsp. equisimilis]|uniref:hypothetical protein n=1 Tax=Streptococcus dysgalactiae TaxID=1334 RepID=UPI001F12FB4C|nr:hypothetical protein [Streptococcus dysgalactiae]MCL6222587.1 hypothetical protein [Streptococcus dysgalactiae subsp. equisimilis]UMY68694.1 hypothetical protein ML603_03065 [Streptococcus dysgalactiae subsp. equisimilis]